MDKGFDHNILNHDSWWFNYLSRQERNEIYVNEKTKAESIVFGNKMDSWWNHISDTRKWRIRKDYKWIFD